VKTIPVALQTHIDGDQVSMALCWIVTKSTGDVIQGTDHDKDITISTGDLAGTYLSAANVTGSDLRNNSDLSVDNMDVETMAVDSPANGITFAEIEAGVINNAPVTVFTCNWDAPDDGQVILRKGYFGEVSVDSDYSIKAEIRGLAQRLSQQIGRVLSDRCDVVRFGDARCGFAVASVTATGVIATVTSNRAFTVTVDSPDPAWPYLPLGGEIAFTGGLNSGFEKEVKTVSYLAGVLTIVLYEEMPEDVVVGDAVEFVAGCDRLYSTCRYYNNLDNFRGYGIFVPGALAVMRGAEVGECSVTLPEDIVT
jgi:uncharacterized phage protein (TIGR02218 family)